MSAKTKTPCPSDGSRGKKMSITKVALYLRSATDSKAIEKQRRELRRFCARQDWKIVKVYKDIGSGLRADRPGLQAMLRDATKGNFELLVVWDMCRLTRSADSAGILYLLKGHGVDFCAMMSGHPRQDHTTASGGRLFASSFDLRLKGLMKRG